MEIGPIPAIRTAPTTKVRRDDPRFAGYLEIENTAEAKEGAFSRNEREMAGGQDGEPEEEEQMKDEREEAGADDAGPTVNLIA